MNTRQFTASLVLLGVIALGPVALAGTPANAPALEVDGAPGLSVAAARKVTVRDLANAAERLARADIHNLGPLSRAEKSRMTRGVSASSADLYQVGIERSLAIPAGFDFSHQKLAPATSQHVGGGLMEQRAGALVWTAGFSSPGAGAIRLLLQNVQLPMGTVAYVYDREGEVHGPYAIGGRGVQPLWTNAVFSSTVFLEIQFPFGYVDLGSARLSIPVLAHIADDEFAPSATNETSSSAEILPACFKDVACLTNSDFGGLASASHAVGQMLFSRDGGMYLCTGALLNTTAGNSIPYFLTANHCIASQDSASSLEVYWDYKNSTCDQSPPPGRSNSPRTLGATLLATGAAGAGQPDFTLVQLAQEPHAGRYYLGWSTSDVSASDGAMVYRVSHPDGGPQMFSSHSISAVPTPGACSGLPQGRFIYSKNVLGATTGGSSGSPVFLESGLKVVGQLYGRCGNNLTDQCDATQNSAVDGAFAQYFSQVSKWLAPASQTPCTVGPENLCLFGGRFKVQLSARDLRSGNTGIGMSIPQNDLFGYFSIPDLTNQPENPEVFVKVLDGRPVTGRFWVFYGGLTDLEFTITITDTMTGAIKVYSKDGGSFCGNADTQAF